MKRFRAIAAVSILFLAACSGGGSGSSEPADTGGDHLNRTGLTAFATEQALETYIKDGLRSSADNPDLSPYAENTLDDAAVAPVAQDGAGATRSYSATNLQESGVDEADRIKTDGRYLYIAPDSFAVYYPQEVRVAEGAATEEETRAEDSKIRIMHLHETPARAEAAAVISLEGFDNQVDGLYLLTGRDNGEPDLLVTIGGTRKNTWEIWNCPWCWRKTRTEIGLFNVSVPEAPRPEGRISLDGHLIASRRIGEYLYLVTRYTPFLEDFEPYPGTDQDRAENEAALEKASLADLLPVIRVDGGETAALIAPEHTFLPPADADRSPDPTLITVTAIDLADPTNRFSETIAGPAETVYVSPESLYVATTRYPYRILVDIPDADAAQLWEPTPPATDIHKFTLTRTGPVYKGSGAVTGNLGWETDKRPFRMGENNGILRVATSLGDTWNETSTTRLTLLREDGTGNLTETAHVDNIGDTGERLYAVRYFGDRAYLVTFRMTDPLYVFDLSDPYRPIAAGELHIQGCSDYLHPIGDTRLLGIGKDAIPDDGSTDFGGRGAWYQGVKLSLFDVSDLSAPSEIADVIIGKRGTHSDALIDHHAVAFLAATSDGPVDGSAARLALPVEMHDTPQDTPLPDDEYAPEKPNTYYDWTHTGLYTFRITDDAIESAGNLIVADRTTTDNMVFFGGYGRDRSVLVEDSVHYIHAGQVWSATWGAPETMTGPQ